MTVSHSVMLLFMLYGHETKYPKEEGNRGGRKLCIGR